MSRKSDSARLETIVMYIDDIAEIVERHLNVANTLADKEGQYAVMMCLVHIGELLGKIEADDLKASLPVKLTAGLRNIIVHNYEGADSQIVSLTISQSLPELRQQIINIVQ